MKIFIRSVVAAAGLLLVPALLLASGQVGRTTRDETSRILTLENAWNQAEANQDAQAITMLLADTFEYTDADGSYKNKQEWLQQVKSGSDHYETLANSGMVVHIYGSAAVVTGEYHERVKLHGKSVTRSGRFTDTWIQQNGEWKCVSSQATPIVP
jgi:ketosteroid isomerase-like protein